MCSFVSCGRFAWFGKALVMEFNGMNELNSFTTQPSIWPLDSGGRTSVVAPESTKTKPSASFFLRLAFVSPLPRLTFSQGLTIDWERFGSLFFAMCSSGFFLAEPPPTSFSGYLFAGLLLSQRLPAKQRAAK